MRCKNCGSENDDNLYICQNCGSPLYEEDEPAQQGNGTTRMFTPPAVGNGYNEAQHIPGNTPGTDPEPEDNNKKQIIIIAVLAVVLVALIVALVVGVVRGKSGNNNTTSSVSVSSVSTTDTSTTEDTEDKTTTEKTTEKTTTTTTTTEAKKQYTISVGTNDSGWAEGGGTFREGDSVKVSCGADDGFKFDGWYKDGKKVSGSQNYTFKANDDVYLEARFVPIETTTEEAQSTEASGIDIQDGGDIG